MLDIGTPMLSTQDTKNTLPFPQSKRSRGDLFNPEAQLDTSRMSNVDERSNPLVSQPMNLRTNNTLPPVGNLAHIEAVQSRANEYLKSKLNRIDYEPEVNKLLMLVKLLGGRV